MDQRHLSLTTSPVGPGALSPRQREVAALIAEGLTNAEIARRMTITPGTAANHVEAVFTRLRVSGRVQVAMWAVAYGLVTVAPPQAANGSTDGVSAS